MPRHYTLLCAAVAVASLIFYSTLAFADISKGDSA